MSNTRTTEHDEDKEISDELQKTLTEKKVAWMIAGLKKHEEGLKKAIQSPEKKNDQRNNKLLLSIIQLRLQDIEKAKTLFEKFIRCLEIGRIISSLNDKTVAKELIKEIQTKTYFIFAKTTWDTAVENVKQVKQRKLFEHSTPHAKDATSTLKTAMSLANTQSATTSDVKRSLTAPVTSTAELTQRRADTKSAPVVSTTTATAAAEPAPKDYLDHWINDVVTSMSIDGNIDEEDLKKVGEYFTLTVNHQEKSVIDKMIQDYVSEVGKFRKAKDSKATGDLTEQDYKKFAIHLSNVPDKRNFSHVLATVLKQLDENNKNLLIKKEQLFLKKSLEEHIKPATKDGSKNFFEIEYVKPLHKHGSTAATTRSVTRRSNK